MECRNERHQSPRLVASTDKCTVLTLSGMVRLYIRQRHLVFMEKKDDIETITA
jgi:hypothetical protein